MNTDRLKRCDLESTQAILNKHLSGAGLKQEALAALALDLVEARPSLQDLMTEEEIAEKMMWSVRSARTFRTKYRGIFPDPLARRALWLRTEVDEFFEHHWKPVRARRSTSGTAVGSADT